MRKTIRVTVWIVVCCVVVVSSLGIGVNAQSAGDNATNKTQSVVDSEVQNNTTRVRNALRGSGSFQQEQVPKQPGGNSTNGSDKRIGVPEDGGENKGKGDEKDKNETNSSLVAFARHLTEVPSERANQLLEENPQKAAKLSDALEKMGYAYSELDRRNMVKDAAKFYLKNAENPTNGGGDKGDGKDKGKSPGSKLGLNIFNDIIGFISNIVTGAVNKFVELIYKAATYTPYPQNIDNWFQNPQNSIWPNQWDMYKTITRPLTFLLLVIATGLFYGFGSKSLHVMNPATEQTMKRRLLVGWVMFPVGWSLGSLYLAVIGFITTILGRGMTEPNLGAGLLGDSLALLVIIAVVIFEFWTVLLMLMLIGLRIAGLVAFLPFLPLFFALRAIPIVSISNSADAIIHLWVYLALLPLPMGVLIAIGFSGGLADMIMQLDVGGVILLACIKIGALVGAIIVPFAMYQKMKEHGFATGFGSDGTVPGDKLKESYKRQRETASRRHQGYQNKKHAGKNFYRGTRGRPEIDQGGQTKLDSTTRAHRWGSTLNRGDDSSDD